MFNLVFQFSVSSVFLPHDAMRKRCLCCRPVSVRLLRWCIVYIRLKISLNLFLGAVAPLFQFLTPSADTQFQEEPLKLGHKIHGDGIFLRFSTEIVVYFGNSSR